uniref:Reverse transcriptase domain-containing protein n=1 Tax=Tanacetum cinerariifolium TaxID=118510 RepID=A0A6L2JKC1_TANCI|nr:reverse transcriptase domain-containing protein [Tanacetum cinerariifolium]
MMADQRTMAQLLQAPTEGYEDAIVVSAITADNFELKHARIWLDKEPPRSIFTWDDLVSKFINQLFPPSKTTNLRNEFTNFQQRFDESFSEAWDRFKDLLRACPHHDIIESKSKVRYSRNKPVVAKVSTNTSTSGISPDVAELKDMVKALLLDKKSQNQAPATVKAVEESSYQAPVYQAPAPQTQGVSKQYFSAYVKANDAVMRNMQTQGQNMQNQLTNLTDLLTKFVNSNNASTSSSGALSSNTIANPRSYLKAITTRSGASYDGPQIPPYTFFLLKVVENKPEATKDTVNPTNNGSTKDVQPPIDLNFNISFVDALILMPKFGPSIKSLLTNKDKLCELARTPLNEHFSVVLLKKLPEKLGDPKLADRSIPHSVEVAEDVYVKVGSFYFSADFVVVDFDADPLVPLILGRSFLKTERALIDVFEGELTLHVGKEAITFNLDQTLRYSTNYNDMTAKRIDVIDMACEEYSQEVLGFSDVIASGNPTPYYDPIVFTTSLTLTPFGNSDFLLEEVDDFLAIEDDPNSPKKLKICEAKSDKSSIDEPPEVELKDLPPHLEYAFLEGDDKLPVIIAKDLGVEENTALITVLKSHKQAIAWKLSDIKDQEKTTFTCPYGTFAYRRMPFRLCNAPGTFHRCMMTIFHDMIKKTMEVLMDDFSVFGNSFQSCLSHLERMLKRCKDTNLCLNWENSHFMVKEGIVLGHKISKQGIKVNKAKVDVITKLPHPTTVKARPMTRLLAKDAPFIFSKEYVEAFQTLKRKLTEAPILIAPDWDMPFELMCDASYFSIGAVLGQRQDKHFRPIHYTSKTMTEAKSNYTTTEKEMLAVVYAFKKFRSYLIMNKSIVYTDHSAPKYLFAKKDSKARLLQETNTYTTINYLSKWVEAKALPTNDARVVCKFFKNLFARFGTPRAITSDRGTHFCNDQFAKVMQNFGVTHRLATPYHPQTSGLVEVSNRGLKRILERTVGENHASWSDKLDDALWAFRTTYKIGCTPYKLVYEKSCHLPIELEHKAYWALKHANFNLKTAGDHSLVQLNELNELRDQAYENSLIYKEKTKRLHDSKIKDLVFNIGNRVLLFNSRLKIFSGKLKSRWSSPFTISYVYPYGTVELTQPDGPNFKVNGHRRKHYFGKDVPKLVVLYLQTFPGTIKFGELGQAKRP